MITTIDVSIINYCHLCDCLLDFRMVTILPLRTVYKFLLSYSRILKSNCHLKIVYALNNHFQLFGRLSKFK